MGLSSPPQQKEGPPVTLRGVAPIEHAGLCFSAGRRKGALAGQSVLEAHSPLSVSAKFGSLSAIVNALESAPIDNAVSCVARVATLCAHLWSFQFDRGPRIIRRHELNFARAPWKPIDLPATA